MILDRVRDPGNLGTMLRTALAAGVEQVLLAPGTVDASNPKVVRAAMGAHLHLPVEALRWKAIAEGSCCRLRRVAGGDGGQYRRAAGPSVLLNTAVATAVILFEVGRQRMAQGHGAA